MRIIKLTFLLVVIFTFNGRGQNIKEQIFLHLNSQDLISGETLYFSVYCTSEKIGHFSPLSKIAYVEIIGDKGAVYQAKIPLINGKGSGEFFISSLISTGNYRIVAYTNWMRNFEDYFEAPVIIVNPFEKFEIDSTKISKGTSMQFVSNSNKLIPGVINTIKYRIKNPDLKHKSFSGKIISGEGEVIANLKHDTFGMGSFQFVPQSGIEYQAVLSDTLSRLQFFNLPKVAFGGTTINYSFDKDYLEVLVNLYPDENTIGRLIVKTVDDVLFKKDIKLNSSHLLPKKELKGKLLCLEVNNQEGRLLAQTCLINQFEFEGVSSSKKSLNVGNRKEVTYDVNLEPGSYSVSVRKLLDNSKPYHTRAVLCRFNNYFSSETVDVNSYFSELKGEGMSNLPILRKPSKNTASGKLNPSISFLPEVRDEFIMGRLERGDGGPLAIQLVALSLPDETSQLRITETDEGGKFFLPFKSSNRDMLAYLSPIELDSDLQFFTEPKFYSPKRKFKERSLYLDSAQIVEIIERSINIQIENVYHTPDSLHEIQNTWLNQFSFDYFYNLDEFERFRSMRETFVEVIPTAGVRKKKSPTFIVNVELPEKTKKESPLVLLNGVPVKDAKILNFSSYKIKSIGVSNKRIFIGPAIFDGVIFMQTKMKNLGGYTVDNSQQEIKIKGVSQPKHFRSITYSKDFENKRPDRREQLYWNPNLKIEDIDASTIVFFTSDVSGTFEVIIEGYTKDGNPVSKVGEFEVK